MAQSPGWDGGEKGVSGKIRRRDPETVKVRACFPGDILPLYRIGQLQSVFHGIAVLSLGGTEHEYENGVCLGTIDGTVVTKTFSLQIKTG